MSVTDEHPSSSPWAPFREPAFRAVWTAGLVANVGMWMQNVGASWMLTELKASPTTIGLLQTAAGLPVFIIGYPAATLGDMVDRKQLLVRTQLWMLMTVLALSVLTLSHVATATVLLACTFSIGIGGAMAVPIWQAVVPDLVRREELPAAVTLNGMSVNLARAVGPAAGGLLAAAAGVGFVFVMNGVTLIFVLVQILRWRQSASTTEAARGGFKEEMLEGLRFARSSATLRAVLIRTAAFIFFGSALWALLPVVARERLHQGSTGFGLLFTALGCGALGGAALLPHLRRRLSLDALVGGASVAVAGLLVVLGTAKSMLLACTALVVGGVAWIAIMSSLNVAAQLAAPDWVRSRALGMYLLVFQGGMALSSAFWGLVATTWGTQPALFAAACGLVFAAVSVRGVRLPGLSAAPHGPSLVAEPHLTLPKR